MAKLKLFSTIFSKLSSLIKKDGQIIISKDSQSLYIDIDGERIEITDWIDINTEEELLATLSPLANKFYYTKDTHKIWRYINSKWEKLNAVVTWETIEGKPNNIVYISDNSEVVNIETPIELTRDDIVDNLNSNDATKVLSAKQGFHLNYIMERVVGTDIAEYSEDSTYAVGDYCIYTDTLYRCITSINIPIAFDSSRWEATTMSDEIKRLNNVGTVYKNKINSVVTVYAREAFNPITIPAGTYIVTMFMIQSEDARAMSWLEVDGTIQLVEHDNYMLCTCNGEIQGTSTRVCMFDTETTLKMFNGSGHDYKIGYSELSAVRIK